LLGGDESYILSENGAHYGSGKMTQKRWRSKTCRLIEVKG